ncbi:MAG: beta strand repeat-containing protein, partial [Synechococcaceae cyanobacterium]
AYSAPATNPFGITAVGSFASPAFADLDRDGDLDLFIGNFYGNTLVFTNTAAPGATAPAYSAPATNPFGITDVGSFASPAFADLDGDGDLDLFIGNTEGNMLVFTNTGSATAPAYSAPLTNPFGITNVGSYASPTFADLDRDGDLDLFIGNDEGNTLVFTNTAAAGATAPAYSAPATNPFGISNAGSFASPALADLDGDGDLDLFIANNDGNTLMFTDTAAAPIAPVASSTANGAYGIDAVITLTVQFSEAVFVTGTPQLQLETGSVDRFATYSSGSGSNTLSFQYTVQAGDISADLDQLSANALTLNGGTIKDAAGNNAILTLATPGAAGSLGASTALVIEAIAPTVTITDSDADTVNIADGTVTFTFTFSEAVTGFSASKVTIGNGSKGTFSAVSSTVYTLLVTPTASASGDITVAVSTTGVTDATGNQATAPAQYSQAFDTAAPLFISGPNLIDTSNITFTIDENGQAALHNESGTLFPPTAIAANTATTLTLAAQASLTRATLKITDGVGNITAAALAFLLGTSSADLINGTNAADFLYGFEGNDTLNGGAGIDTLIGGLGNDTYIVDSTTDTISEDLGAGIDTVESSVTYTLGANLDNLILTGTAAINGTGNALNNTLTGNTADNILTGGDGNDTLDGRSGNDTLIGGTGNDTFVLDSPADVIIENPSEGTDSVSAAFSYTLAADLENLTLTGTAAINGTGNALNNTLTGNTANNILYGGAGIDTLIGGLGNDTYIIDSTTDTITEDLGAGIDTVQSSVTYTLGANLDNLILSGTAAINGTGNTLNNTLTGNTADNILNGGAGIDTLIGGLGNDTYIINSTTDTITEDLGAGIDTVQSSVTYTLGANL